MPPPDRAGAGRRRRRARRARVPPATTASALSASPSRHSPTAHIASELAWYRGVETLTLRSATGIATSSVPSRSPRARETIRSTSRPPARSPTCSSNTASSSSAARAAPTPSVPPSQYHHGPGATRRHLWRWGLRAVASPSSSSRSREERLRVRAPEHRAEAESRTRRRAASVVHPALSRCSRALRHAECASLMRQAPHVDPRARTLTAAETHQVAGSASRTFCASSSRVEQGVERACRVAPDPRGRCRARDRASSPAASSSSRRPDLVAVHPRLDEAVDEIGGIRRRRAAGRRRRAAARGRMRFAVAWRSPRSKRSTPCPAEALGRAARRAPRVPGSSASSSTR